MIMCEVVKGCKVVIEKSSQGRKYFVFIIRWPQSQPCQFRTISVPSTEHSVGTMTLKFSEGEISRARPRATSCDQAISNNHELPCVRSIALYQHHQIPFGCEFRPLHISSLCAVRKAAARIGCNCIVDSVPAEVQLPYKANADRHNFG
jgi:hypothetical protein